MVRSIPLVDLVFLLLDRPDTPANVGVLMRFEPPPGRKATGVVREIVRSYRAARPAFPFDCVPELSTLALPQWRTASAFDPRWHVRQLRLAAPGDDSALRTLVAELHREPLDRSRPLFQLFLIDGLASGEFAFYLKSHHASWDGRSALHRLYSAFGEEPGEIREPFFADHESFPSGANGPAEILRWALAQAGGLRDLLPALAARASRAQTGSSPLPGNRPFGGPSTRFNLAVRQQRSFAGFSLPLNEMREVSRHFGGKLNDVVLAVVDAGVERYLAALKERPRQPLVAMCPVSIREEGDLETTTKVATMFVPLATPRLAVAERMRQIVDNTRAAKDELGRFSNEAKIDYALFAFGLWWSAHALGLDAFTRPVVNMVVSNVGGVQGPRFLGRSRLVGAYPVSMLADPVGLNVSTLSGDGRMDFGIVANRAAVPDADEIAGHCSAAFQTLLRETRRSARPAARSRRRPDTKRRRVSASR